MAEAPGMFSEGLSAVLCDAPREHSVLLDIQELPAQVQNETTVPFL